MGLLTDAAISYSYHKSAVNQYAALIVDAARAYGVPPQIVAGIMSRESGGGTLLSPKGPAGTGDGGHGHGLMQIDDRSHGAFINSGKWKIPRDNINYGTALLAAYRVQAVEKGVPSPAALYVALAGYNRGLTGAARAFLSGSDPDAGTTKANYAHDVLARAELWKDDYAPTGAELKALKAALPLALAWILGWI